MFCPNCKTEYRCGFTECSDCRAKLVETLPEDSRAPTLKGDPEEMIVLWADMDAATRQTIERALERANIKYNSDTLESQLMPAFRTTIYRLQLLRGDYQAPLEALKGVYSEDSVAREYPAHVLDKNSSFLNMLGINRNPMNRLPGEAAVLEDGDAGSAPEPEPPEQIGAEDSVAAEEIPSSDAVEDFIPEDATSEVWSGEDGQVAEFIKASLSANGIGCAQMISESKQRAMVLPADETRAKEIVREIIEDTPLT